MLIQVYQPIELILIVKATFGLYRQCIVQAWREVLVQPAFFLLIPAYFIGLKLLVPFLAFLDQRSFAYLVFLSLLICYAIVHFFAAITALHRGDSLLSVDLFKTANRSYPYILLVAVFGVLVSKLLFLVAIPPMAVAGLSLLLLLLFNAVPEALIVNEGTLVQRMLAALQYVKDQWFEWLLPTALLLILFVVSGMLPQEHPCVALIDVTLFADYIKRVYVVASLPSPVSLVFTTLMLELLAFFFVFRLKLFCELPASSRRARMFREKHLRHTNEAHQ